MEQRKEPRIPLRIRAFAVDWDASHRLGEVLDMSPAGMAFSHMDESGDGHAGDVRDFGIFSSGGQLFLPHVSFRILSDIPIPGHPASSISMRRLGGCFDHLSAEQETLIREFICRQPPIPED